MWTRGRTIGRGFFGFVSLAISRPSNINNDQVNSLTPLPSFMAVKSTEISQSRSLRKERKLLTQFEDCPNVLRCYGDDVTDENGVTLYNLLLEYAGGGSLAGRIHESWGGKLCENEARQYTKSILLGLSHIHRHGYVHCDIKPHNILLVPASSSSSWVLFSCTDLVKENVVKIADFGLAKKAGGRKEKKNKGLRGTPLYMAPESVRRNEYEPHSDIWALGCTVVEMLTGKPAWNWGSNVETCAVLYRIGCTRQLPEIPSCGISKEGQDFMKKCLVRDPKSRWTADMLLNHPFVFSYT